MCQSSVSGTWHPELGGKMSEIPAASQGKGWGDPAVPSPCTSWGAANLPLRCRKLLADVAGSGTEGHIFSETAVMILQVPALVLPIQPGT